MATKSSIFVLLAIASVLSTGCGQRPDLVPERIARAIASHMPCGEREAGVPKNPSAELAERRCIITRGNPADEREWYSVMPVEVGNCDRLRAALAGDADELGDDGVEVYFSEQRAYRGAVYEYHAKYGVFRDGNEVRWKMVDRWILSLANEASGLCSIIVWMRLSYESDDVYGEDAPARFGICQDVGQGVEDGADAIVESYIPDCHYRAGYRPGWEQPDEPLEFFCPDFSGQAIPSRESRSSHACHNLARPTPRPETWVLPNER